jgi:hypothetical protein
MYVAAGGMSHEQTLRAYGEDLRRAANSAADVCARYEPLFDDIDTCNGIFEEAGRPDLALGEVAVMRSFRDPMALKVDGNNFIANWRLRRDDGTPLTREHVLGIRNDQSVLEDTFPSLANKPAYQRLLIAALDFTADLTVDASAPDTIYPAETILPLLPRMYAGYCLLTRLVDESDRGVIRDGAVDGYYLCR